MYYLYEYSKMGRQLYVFHYFYNLCIIFHFYIKLHNNHNVQELVSQHIMFLRYYTFILHHLNFAFN